MATTEKPDVDEAIEQAWHNLYARMDVLAPLKVPEGEQAAHAIIKTLGQQLHSAAIALHNAAETIKLQPRLDGTARLRLANSLIQAAARAREAAESVQG